jgi:hypothetical protein
VEKLYYQDLGEPILLFNPIPGKSVKQWYLCDKDRLLQDIIEDTRKVPTIIKNGDIDKTPLKNALDSSNELLRSLCIYGRLLMKMLSNV